MSINVLTITWLHVTIVIVIVVWFTLVLRRACSSILLGNPTFQLIYCAFFKFLSHDFFLSEPCIFLISIFIKVLFTLHLLICTRCLRMTSFTLLISRIVDIWGSHIEHYIIKVIIVIVVVIVRLSSWMITTLRNFWLLEDNINMLIICARHIFLDEVINSLTETNLVV